MKSKNRVFLTLVMLLAIGLMTACLNSVNNVSDNENQPVQIEAQEEPAEEEAFEQPIEEMEAEPSPLVEAIDQPAENNGVENPSSDTADGSLVFCDAGMAAAPNNWYDNLAFDITANDQTINFSTTLPVIPVDQVYFAGVDIRSLTGYQTAQIPGFALGEGTTFGVSFGIQGNSIVGNSAIRAGEQGEILPWETAATAGINEGVFTIAVPLNEIGNDTDKFRFTFSDGVVCQLSGRLDQDLGFTKFADFAPEVGEKIIKNANQIICFPELCFSLPGSASWSSAGDRTGNVTIAGAEFALQSYLSTKNTGEILNTFENIGWKAAPYETYVAALHDVQVYEMQANNASYGFLGLNTFNNTENPRTVVLSLIGSAPLLGANQDAVYDFFTQSLDSVRSGL